MAVTNETQNRDAQTNDPSQLSRFGHDPLELTAWGELLDESWGKEFDRRLAAWETESPAGSVPTADHDLFRSGAMQPR